MEYPNPNPKAKAVKKFIEAYYRQVKDVDITYYTEDVPKIVVYFNQDDVQIANEDIVFREEIIRDIKKYFDYKAVSTSLFDWEKNNANTFFAFFGQDFKFFMEEKVKNDDSLNSSIKNFLEIGRERNRLVHQNFGNYNIEKTLEEIFESYKQSLNFTTKIIDYIEEYHNL